MDDDATPILECFLGPQERVGERDMDNGKGGGPAQQLAVYCSSFRRCDGAGKAKKRNERRRCKLCDTPPPGVDYLLSSSLSLTKVGWIREPPWANDRK